MSNQQVGAVALVALASWALAKLGYSLVSAPKESRLTLHVHEIRGPPKPTLIAAAGPGANDLTKIGFGSFLVFDNEIRDGPDRGSALLGRERGYGPISDLKGEQGIQLTSTMFFNPQSRYNGTLSFHGNVGGPNPITELLVLGGTGDFRGAKGYALVETLKATPLEVVFRWSIYLSY
jgi:hypothetical protein